MPPISSSRQTRSRQRVRKACMACRLRKRKCDSGFPCGMCVAYGYDCRFPTDDSPAAAFLPRPATAKPSTQQVRNGEQSGHEGSETAQQPLVDRGILDPCRSRFVGQSSVVAFPRSLGQSFESQQPLALHSFGWNLGTRPEEISEDSQALVTLISRDDLDIYTSTFFTILGPIFDVVDQTSFSARCLALYEGEVDYAFGAIIAGVIALGSLFNIRPYPQELEIIRFAKRVLEDPVCTRRPSIDQVAGWILRTIYLRATTRPNNAWLASSTTMHLVEAIGLHNDPATVQLTSEDAGEFERRRRLFWCALALNKIISYEYSRTAISIPNITCKSITPIVGSFMPDWIRIIQTIPTSQTNHDLPESLMNSLRQVSEITPTHPMLRMTKADVSFCFFRRLRQHGLNIPTNIVEILLSVGEQALEAATELIQGARPWWNILGAVFQYTCVLLALDTPNALSHVPGSMSVLETIVKALDTHLAREALATARVLVRAAMAKKRRELAFLEQAMNENNEATENAATDPRNEIFTPQEMTDLGIDWDVFLNDPFPFTFTDSDLTAQNDLAFP